MSIRHCIVGVILSICASTSLAAQTPDIEFFEAKIRPVLVQKCYGCHNSKMPAPKGSLVLDTKEGLLKGGVSGPALVPGKPAESRLITALSYTDPLVADAAERQASRRGPRRLRAVDCRGAADPRASAPALAAAAPQYKGMSLEEGRKWWAFQPVAAHAGAEGRAGAMAGRQPRSTTSSSRSCRRRSSRRLRRPTSARW